jgi:hypothetical protein
MKSILSSPDCASPMPGRPKAGETPRAARGPFVAHGGRLPYAAGGGQS